MLEESSESDSVSEDDNPFVERVESTKSNSNFFFPEKFLFQLAKLDAPLDASEPRLEKSRHSCTDFFDFSELPDTDEHAGKP